VFSPYWQEDDGLQERHKIDIGSLLAVKKEKTKDLLTIFSDIVEVKFKKGDGHQMLRGWWCLPCK
jgi:hypothetical protein